MLKKCLALIAILPVILFTGCKQDGALLTVNKDGSGTLVLRQYANLQAAGGLGGPGGGFPGGGGADLKPKDKSEASVKAIGEACGVTFTSGKSVKNKMGWPGYEGTFSFQDINKVKLTFGFTLKEEDPSGFSSSTTEDGSTPEYSFKFTPGASATLQIIPDAKTMGGGDKAPPANDPAAKQQMKMMAPMFAGMRSTIMVKVNGTVTQTNADIPVGKSKNTFVLVDMQMDKMFLNDKLMAEMEKFPKGPPNKSYNETGFKLQNASMPTTIEFK